MKLKISFYFLFLVVVLNQVVFSQEDLFRKSFKITGGLPFAIANKDFKELMKSIKTY
jgi:hypothetical protein